MTDFAGNVRFRYLLEFEINLPILLNRSQQVAINVCSRVRTRLRARGKWVAYGSGGSYDPAIQAVARRLVIKDALHVEMGMAGKYIHFLRFLER